jgi:hypothetical protein
LAVVAGPFPARMVGSPACGPCHGSLGLSGVWGRTGEAAAPRHSLVDHALRVPETIRLVKRYL